MKEMVTRKIDSQGRIVLPVAWRRKVVNSDKVVVLAFDDRIEIYPGEADLSQFIDAVDIPISEETYLDYHRLRKTIREEANAVS